MLKHEIEKKYILKKRLQNIQLESTRVNLSKLQFRSCDYNNFIQSKSKKKYKTQFSINPILKN